MTEPSVSTGGAERPYTLIAELTYRCPLRCVYCSNPIDFARHVPELQTDDWMRVFRQAEALGVVQVNLTGGEPLLRRDLEALVAETRALDLYTNLITSGVPLDRTRLEQLRDAGLCSVQVSLQDIDARESDRIAGRPSFEQKLQVAGWVKELGLPLTLNCVLHRGNLPRVAGIIELAERLGADRLELANAQYLGWALENRTALLPTRDELASAREITRRERERLKGRMEILFVLPDYYSDYPKACMGGWGQRYIVVSPDGLGLPCHLAHTLPGLAFDNVRDRSLEAIWRESEGFNAFRGQAWMAEPCRSCEHRGRDFGGCRCQAYHLTKNAAATDPACVLSPDHGLIEAARERTEIADRPIQLRYRSARLASGRSARDA